MFDNVDDRDHTRFGQPSQPSGLGGEEPVRGGLPQFEEISHGPRLTGLRDRPRDLRSGPELGKKASRHCDELAIARCLTAVDEDRSIFQTGADAMAAPNGSGIDDPGGDALP